MKGFPNQITEFEKLAAGMRVLVSLVEADKNLKDDGVFGEALVRAGILGTGHIRAESIEAYLDEQRQKPTSNQSHRASARGLRELYRLMGFIDDAGPEVEVTRTGHQAADFAGSAMNDGQVEFWRRSVNGIRHYGKDNEASHPYQVMLRLIGRKPGISRAMCALALEARNDTLEELNRIARLADLSEAQARAEIEVTKSNWDNAKKVLPRFAEQLGDVIKTGHTFVLAEAPGAQVTQPTSQVAATGKRAGRRGRQVTPETIAGAGMGSHFTEVDVPDAVDPAAIAAAVELRAVRLRRHNTLVRAVANRLAGSDRLLLEDPFDLLAVIGEAALLFEMKTLDGTSGDERDRVQEALAQLLYYEAFATQPETRGDIRKIACFEKRISERHREFLNLSDIAVIWIENGEFCGDGLAVQYLGDFIKEIA